jgi:hypothetical protein
MPPEETKRKLRDTSRHVFMVDFLCKQPYH